MTHKHLSKKELKEDPFFEEVAHVLTFFQKYQKQLLITGIILIVAVGGFFGVRSYYKQQNIQASGYFGIAMDYYNKGQLMEAEDQFLMLSEQYDKSDWGKRANYYLALVSRSMGRPEEETLSYLETYAASKVKDNTLKASAYQLIASYYYRNGDVLTAGENFMNAAKHALSNGEKLSYGIRAIESFREADDQKKIDAAVKYLSTLELSDAEKTRVTTLSKI